MKFTSAALLAGAVSAQGGQLPPLPWLEPQDPGYQGPDQYKGPADVTCDNAPFISYHLHTVIWQNNKVMKEKTLEFREKFMKAFNVEDKDCEMNQGDPGAQFADICPFPIDWEPFGPFLTGTMAFFVPRQYLEEVAAFTRHNRADLDAVIHPNSGCEVHDHTIWPHWFGKTWQLDPSVFTCNYPGCHPTK